MLERYLDQFITKVPMIRNAYGDLIIDYTQDTQVVGCRFRVIARLQRSNSRETLHSEQAEVWFSPDTEVAVNDIFSYENQYWQVTTINEARRLGRTKIEFLKCYVTAYGVVS